MCLSLSLFHGGTIYGKVFDTEDNNIPREKKYHWGHWNNPKYLGTDDNWWSSYHGQKILYADNSIIGHSIALHLYAAAGGRVSTVLSSLWPPAPFVSVF
jgi:hypothetical protein